MLRTSTSVCLKVEKRCVATVAHWRTGTLALTMMNHAMATYTYIRSNDVDGDQRTWSDTIELPETSTVGHVSK